MSKIIETAPAIHLEDLITKGAANYTPDFRILTAGIEPDTLNSRRVHMVGSSTEKDMQGDTMSIQALNSMTKAAPNLTIWLNHNYDLPDSIFGSILGAPQIRQAEGIADLHLDVDVEFDNPAAARVKRYIDNGRRLGCSIGCMVTKYEVPDEQDGPDWFRQPIVIHDVYVVEYSVVGIPANQRSWVENAIRGVFTRTIDPRLAPAMKSLWPRQFHEIVEGIAQEDKALAQEFLALPMRPGERQRLDWSAASKTFIFTVEGKQKELGRDEVALLMKQVERVPLSAMPVQKLDEAVLDEALEDGNLDYIAGVCGSTSWPLDMESSWDKGAAHARLLAWAGGKENFSPAKFKRVHFRFEGDGTKISDYGFPFCDIKDGKVMAIWHAIVAAAGALGGARGGTNAGDSEKAGIRRKVAAYYRKAGKTPPWEGGDDSKGDEKAMNEDEVYAVNEDGSQGVLLAKDGTAGENMHEKMTGTHTHRHHAYGFDGKENHRHKHSHHNDNVHKHSHADLADGDGDNDSDDQKSLVDIDAYALNADGSQGIILKASKNSKTGNDEPHEVTTGRHAHHHPSHGHGDVDVHHHMHDHANDNQHHHDHAYMGDGEYCDDYDHDGKSDHGRYSTKPEVQKEAVPTMAALLAPDALARTLEAYNAFGKYLGLPEVTVEQVQAGEHPVAHKDLEPAHLMHLQHIHDAAVNMSGGSVCANYQSMGEVVRDAQAAEGRDMTSAMDVLSGFATEVKSLGDSLAAIKHFVLMQKEVSDLGKRVTLMASSLHEAEQKVAGFVDTVEALKNMPLGHPLGHSRTVHASDNVASYADMLGAGKRELVADSLSQALALTTIKQVNMNNGQFMKYRHWPEGVGGDVLTGIRPALTNRQIMFMSLDDVAAYRNGGEADVPTLDDPAAKGTIRVHNNGVGEL